MEIDLYIFRNKYYWSIELKKSYDFENVLKKIYLKLNISINIQPILTKNYDLKVLVFGYRMIQKPSK